MKEEKFVRVTLLERTSETARETERGRERQHYSYTSNDPAMNFHWRCRSVYFFHQRLHDIEIGFAVAIIAQVIAQWRLNSKLP